MKLKEMYNSYSDSQKNLIKMFGVLAAIILIFFIIILFMKVSRGGRINYNQLEEVIVRSAENYVKANPNTIEDEVFGTTEIDVDTLVSNGYMKELSRYLGKNHTCNNVKVLVYKNLDYYKYIPKVTCDDYSVTSLIDEILKEDNIVTSGSGIYKDNDKYVYRGEYVENYVSFAGETWRIISLEENGDIKLIQNDAKDYSVWDNRYNSDLGYNGGINSYQGIEASRLKNTIMANYNKISSENKALVVPKEYCVGKRSENDENKNGASECIEKTELIGATTLNIYEFLNASLDTNCRSISSKACVNYNYLAKLDKSFWSITAQKDNTNGVYYISSGIQKAQATSSYAIRLVLTVNGNINYISGDGTITSPYVIK